MIRDDLAGPPTRNVRRPAGQFWPGNSVSSSFLGGMLGSRGPVLGTRGRPGVWSPPATPGLWQKKTGQTQIASNLIELWICLS